MSDYAVNEVNSKRDYLAFFSFPFALYKNCGQWVPPITKEEKAIFNPSSNPVFENAEAKLFLVKKGKQVVGRMAAMINWIEVKEQGKTKVRFGWYIPLMTLKSVVYSSMPHMIGESKTA